MRMQGQANYPLNEPPDLYRRTAETERLPLVLDELQLRLPLSRNRTPLEGMTV